MSSPKGLMSRLSGSPNLKKLYRNNRHLFSQTIQQPKSRIQNLNDFLEHFNKFRFFDDPYPKYLYRYFSNNFKEIFDYFYFNFTENGEWKDYSIIDFYLNFVRYSIIEKSEDFIIKCILCKFFDFDFTLEIAEYAKKKENILVNYSKFENQNGEFIRNQNDFILNLLKNIYVVIIPGLESVAEIRSDIDLTIVFDNTHFSDELENWIEFTLFEFKNIGDIRQNIRVYISWFEHLRTFKPINVNYYYNLIQQKILFISEYKYSEDFDILDFISGLSQNEYINRAFINLNLNDRKTRYRLTTPEFKNMSNSQFTPLNFLLIQNGLINTLLEIQQEIIDFNEHFMVEVSFEENVPDDPDLYDIKVENYNS